MAEPPHEQPVEQSEAQPDLMAWAPSPFPCRRLPPLRLLSRPVEPLQKHDVEEYCCLKPEWCDICQGVLTSNAIQCMGPCGRKCHRGVGKNTFSCYASLLASPCDSSAKPVHKGRFRFRDVIRQWGRDLKTSVKEQVVEEALREQRKLGNLSKVEQLAAELRGRWDDAKAKRCFFFCQTASIFIVYILTYLSTVLIGAPLYGVHGWRLACLQAAHSVNLALALEGSLVLFFYALSRQVERYSELIHAFFKEILHVDMLDLHIDLMQAGSAVEGLMCFALVSTAGLAAFSVAIWLREFAFAGGCVGAGRSPVF